MPKISALPPATDVTGDETVVMVKDGQTRRGAMGILVGAAVAPAVAEAAAARDIAVNAKDLTLLAALAQGPFASTSAGLAATADGAYFYTVDPANLYRNDGGSAVLQDEVATLGRSLGPMSPEIVPDNSTIKQAIEAIGNNLEGDNGAEFVRTKYPEAGSRRRTFAEVARKTIELSGFTGADPTGTADSMAAFKAALAACTTRRAELVIDGYYRLNNAPLATPPTITQPTRIVGRDPRRGNIPGNNSTSQLYFEGISADGIIVNDTQLTLDGVSVVGRGRDTSGNGIRTIGENSALRLCNGTLIQSFQVGAKYDNGYYHVIDDATIVDCVNALTVSFPTGGIPSIYNLIADKLKVVAASQPGANSTCANIFNGSQVLFSNSSFESFTANGIVIAGNTTTVAVTDSYFEGFGGDNILLLAGAAVNAFRNYVYLTTGAATFINAAENVTSINAGQNRFAIPELADIAAAIAYKLRLSDSNSQSHVLGDQWSVAPGPNAIYVESPGNATFMRGKHVVQYPVGHPRQFQPINTVGLYASPGFAGGTPPPTTLASWLANGDPPQDDPIGARAANGFAWGSHPYLAVYHKDQWEKVGLRLANIADATDEADMVAKFNLLLAELRAAAVMI